MKKIKRMLAVFLYLFIVSVVLRLEIRELLNLRQLLLVIAGGLILLLPSIEWKEWRENRKPGYGLIARNMLYASYIETFILLFFMLSGGEVNGVEQTYQNEAWTAQECYERFLELGLTRREAEVAVQVGKGLSNKEIAMELNITEATVKKHVANIFEKLAVEKREEIRDRLTQ